MSDCVVNLWSSWYLWPCLRGSSARKPCALQGVMRKSPWYGICAAIVVLPAGCHVGGGGMILGGGRFGGGVGGAGGVGGFVVVAVVGVSGVCVVLCVVVYCDSGGVGDWLPLTYWKEERRPHILRSLLLFVSSRPAVLQSGRGLGLFWWWCG
jgi:hypothetical protein